jgi:mannitol/fructose-specific phosphotransferase system IIA component (Ntr-type)
MKLSEIVQPDCIAVPLPAPDKRSAVFALADLLIAHTPIADGDALKQAIWARETTRTTGIGHGIAIPHGKCDGVDELRMAIGRCETPVEFNAIDGKPVELIILLASPIDQTGPHIQALAKVSRLLTDADFREQVKATESPTEMFELLIAREAQQAGV